MKGNITDQLFHNRGNPKSCERSIINIVDKSSNIRNMTIELKPYCTDIPSEFEERFVKVRDKTKIGIR